VFKNQKKNLGSDVMGQARVESLLPSLFQLTRVLTQWSRGLAAAICRKTIGRANPHPHCARRRERRGMLRKRDGWQKNAERTEERENWTPLVGGFGAPEENVAGHNRNHPFSTFSHETRKPKPRTSKEQQRGLKGKKETSTRSEPPGEGQFFHLVGAKEKKTAKRTDQKS